MGHRKAAAMTLREFNELHGTCTDAMRGYFLEVEKTTTMLNNCTAKPLPFKARIKLMKQQVAENDSHAALAGLKRRLFDAARFGYESST
jgi:hypothetical protein